MAAKNSSAQPKTFVLTDNVPPGHAVSLSGVPGVMSFASMFREELQARGFGLLPREEGRRERKRVD